MTFEKPTFTKPEAAQIAELDYVDIYMGLQKIGTLTKVKHNTGFTYALDVMYNKYEFKQSERALIMTTIEIDYTQAMFRILDSFKNHEILDGVVDKFKTVKDAVESKYKMK